MKDEPKKSRHEFKYIVDESMVPIIIEYLAKIGLKKDISQGGEYPVTSLYFDTPFLNDYHDKIDGIKSRKKLRARVYKKELFDEDEIWLEIKEKHDMNISKTRCEIKKEDFKALLDGSCVSAMEFASKKDKNVEKFLFQFFARNYRAVNIVRYQRNAYVDEFTSDIRLTIDREIETCMWRDYMDNNGLLYPMWPGQAIVEIKFKGAMPWWFKDMIKRFRLSRSSFSKYTHSIDYITRMFPLAR